MEVIQMAVNEGDATDKVLREAKEGEAKVLWYSEFKEMQANLNKPKTPAILTGDFVLVGQCLTTYRGSYSATKINVPITHDIELTETFEPDSESSAETPIAKGLVGFMNQTGSNTELQYNSIMLIRSDDGLYHDDELEPLYYLSCVRHYLRFWKNLTKLEIKDIFSKRDEKTFKSTSEVLKINLT